MLAALLARAPPTSFFFCNNKKYGCVLQRLAFGCLKKKKSQDGRSACQKGQEGRASGQAAASSSSIRRRSSWCQGTCGWAKKKHVKKKRRTSRAVAGRAIRQPLQSLRLSLLRLVLTRKKKRGRAHQQAGSSRLQPLQTFRACNPCRQACRGCILTLFLDEKLSDKTMFYYTCGQACRLGLRRKELSNNKP